MRRLAIFFLDECASQPYLIRVELVWIALSIGHATDFHGKEDILLLSLDQGQPRLGERDVILLQEVIVYTHVRGLASGFLSHVELVLFGIEPRYLLDSPDLGF